MTTRDTPEAALAARLGAHTRSSVPAWAATLHDIEAEGYTIVPAAEIERLRAALDTLTAAAQAVADWDVIPGTSSGRAIERLRAALAPSEP